MQARHIHHILNFTFLKKSKEIIDAADKKIYMLIAKVTERTERISKIKLDYGIDDATLSLALSQMRQKADAQSYTVNKMSNGHFTEETVTLSAGIINNILTEQDYINSEKEQVKKLTIIVRNLTDLPDESGKLQGHQLTYDELEYLGF